jgi:hypothetical protein
MSAQIDTVSAQAEELARTADDLRGLVQQFVVERPAAAPERSVRRGERRAA